MSHEPRAVTGLPHGQAAPPRPAPEAAVESGGGRAAAGRYGLPAVAAATVTALGLWGLARDSTMGNDEVATRWAALLSLPRLAHLVNHVDAVHGTYYLFLHGWMAVGTSPAVMRVPSVIAAAIAAALVVVIGRRLSGSAWTGLLAGLIMALTPAISFFAQTARSYAMVFACVLGATLALLRALDAGTRGLPRAVVARRWLAYAGLVALAGYLNELSLAVLAAHAVTVLLARYGRRVVAHWAIAAAAGAVAVAPLAVISTHEQNAVDWITRPGLHDVLVLFRDYFGPTNWVAVLIFGYAVIALLPPGPRRSPGEPGRPSEPASPAAGVVAPAVPWWRSGGVSLPSVAAPLLVMPAAVLMLQSLATRPLYVDRYVLYGEAGAALLAAAGAVRLGQRLAAARRRRTLILLPGALLCVFALVFQLGPQRHERTPQSRLYDFGDPAFYVGTRARPGDGVLFFNLFFRKIRLGYPADFRKVSDLAQGVPPARAGNFDGTDKPFAEVGPLMLGYRRIWVVGRAPGAVLTAPPIRAQSLLLRRRFTLVAERRFHGITVTLWARRSGAASRLAGPAGR